MASPDDHPAFQQPTARGDALQEDQAYALWAIAAELHELNDKLDD